MTFLVCSLYAKVYKRAVGQNSLELRERCFFHFFFYGPIKTLKYRLLIICLLKLSNEKNCAYFSIRKNKVICLVTNIRFIIILNTF